MMRFNSWKVAVKMALMLVLPSSGALAQQACALRERQVPLPVEDLRGFPISTYRVRIAIPSQNPADPNRSRVLEVDTGSTGIVVPIMDVPTEKWNASTRLGEVFYSSNNAYHPGKIITTPLRLGWSPRRAAWAAEVSAIDILVAQCTCAVQDDPNPKPAPTQAPASCGGYEGTKANVVGRSLSLTRCQDIHPGFGMMGVGYDRGVSTAKNPFLRLTEMDKGTMSAGYELTSKGITLGVTKAMLEKYKLLQLQPGSAPKLQGQPNPSEWQAPTACATFPKSAKDYSLCGPLLPDTGIDYMMLTQSQDNEAPTPLNIGKQVPAKTEMTITVGPSEAPVLQYTYSVGDGPPAPKVVEWRGPVSPPAHINTGRYVLAKADYLYDAACGHAGFKVVPPATSK